MLEHRRATEGQDELDVVVAVGARHRGHEGHATGQAEDLVKRHARAREDPGRIDLHDGSMPG
jgi:hypothetical protein